MPISWLFSAVRRAFFVLFFCFSVVLHACSSAFFLSALLLLMYSHLSEPLPFFSLPRISCRFFCHLCSSHLCWSCLVLYSSLEIVENNRQKQRGQAMKNKEVWRILSADISIRARNAHQSAISFVAAKLGRSAGISRLRPSFAVDAKVYRCLNRA